MSTGTIVLIVIAAVVVILYSIYANIIRLKNQAKAALSSIEVQLRKRYDLIPQLLTVAKRFMEHERSLMEDITRLRTEAMSLSQAEKSSDVQQLFKADSQLAHKLSQFKVAMEAYPDLRSAETTQEAMVSFKDVEDNISAARRFYNAAVAQYNTQVETFPGTVVASMIRLDSMPFYEDANKEAIKQTIDVSKHL